MRLSITLSWYIGRQFLFWFLMTFVALALVILMGDLIELMRRAAAKPEATFGAVVEMGFLKLPHMTEVLIPFAVLFGAMFAFFRLTRSNELVVARAAGVSVWQFLLPALLVALVIGALNVTIYGPLASTAQTRFEALESTYLERLPSSTVVSQSGFWLRDADGPGHILIHAERVSPDDHVLSEVIVFRFDADQRFAGRIDARTARLDGGHWDLRDIWITGPDATPAQRPDMRIETDLTWSKIESSFASPESMSIWELPGYIAILETAGFSAVAHRLHYNSLLASPVLLCAMVLIAATFSLRPSRRGGAGYMVLGGVVAGFLLYIVSDIVFTLGGSARIPVTLAAWTPAGISTLLGIATLFHLEDG